LTNFANRIRVSSPGIIAAIVLTVAALGFLAAALFGAGKVEPIVDVAKPQPVRPQQQERSSEQRPGITPVLSHKTAH
jgi:hypothetical protein